MFALLVGEEVEAAAVVVVAVAVDFKHIVSFPHSKISVAFNNNQNFFLTLTQISSIFVFLMFKIK
jgi:hypothetical protein